MLLIQTAFAQETAAILRAGKPGKRADGLISVEIGGRACAVFETGIGLRAADRSWRQLLARLPPPRLVLSLGLAGSLRPELKLGDWALIESVQRLDGGVPLVSQLEWMRRGLNAGDNACLRSAKAFFDSGRRTRLVSLKQAALTRAEKQEIAQRVTADLCDMETYAVASLCGQRQIPWLGLRIVSDTTQEELQAWTAALPNLIAHRRWWRFVYQLATHPQDLPALVRLGFRMQTLQRQLTRLTQDLVTHVPLA